MPLTPLFRNAVTLRRRPRARSNRRRTNGGRGFTVLELLVCFGIIAVLLSLLLPAVAKARRAALRTRCQNNLKQINLALSLYHDQFDTFPPGYVSRGVSRTDGAAQETGPGFAWGCLLLDFLEQTAFASGIDFSLDITDPANFGNASAVLPMWTCPAAGAEPAFEVELDWGPFLLGSSSYVGMYGFGSLTEQPGAPPGPGILYRNSHVPIFAIRDGSSNTIIIGERVARYIVSDELPPIDAGATWIAAVPGAFRPAGIAGHPDHREGPASLVLGTVGQQEPFPYVSRPNRTTHIAAFSSHHGGGFHAGFADTSVRFLSDRIDAETFRRLGQHSDGEPAGEF